MSVQRSECPIAQTLEMLGDRWTLLVVRDIALGGKSRFSELASSPENIPPSTLTDRLERLTRNCVVTKERAIGGPGRQYRYGLTRRGVDLIPVLLSLLRWGVRHGESDALTAQFEQQLESDFEATCADLMAQWQRCNAMAEK